MWNEKLTPILGFVVALMLAFSVASIFRHQTGTAQEIDGVVQSSGMYETGGTRLEGRVASIALVRLADGKLVRVALPNAVPLEKGTRVKVRAYPQNVGQPKYSLLSVVSVEH